MARCGLSAMPIPNAKRTMDFDRSGHVEIPPEAVPTGSEITITFWAYGGPDLPFTNSVTEATDANGRKSFNVHFPWGDGNIYWDCGTTSSGYDRIYTGASSSEYRGRWEHWAFTKNTSTGHMRIYKGGDQWHSGSGKGRQITTATEASLGANANGSNPWQGQVQDYRIFAAELSSAEITQVRDSDGTPLGNEVLHYKMEGAGDTVLDASGNGHHGTIVGATREVTR